MENAILITAESSDDARAITNIVRQLLNTVTEAELTEGNISLRCALNNSAGKAEFNDRLNALIREFDRCKDEQDEREMTRELAEIIPFPTQH